MIREYRVSDLDRIKELHRRYDFELPDLEKPLVMVRDVLVDEEDVVRMAGFGRLHLNALLLVDPEWGDPAKRFEKVQELQNHMLAEAKTLGIDIATTQMDGRFAERMQELGWKPGYGRLFFRDIP